MQLLSLYLLIGFIYALWTHDRHKRSFDETADVVGFWVLLFVHYGLITVFWPIFVAGAIWYATNKTKE